MATTFDTDLSSYLSSRENTGEDIAADISTSLDNVEVLDEAMEATLSMISGEIPDDVVAEIERLTAEQSITGGFTGEASSNLTSRDLGLTSFEIMQQGIANAATLGEVETQRQQFEVETQQELAEFYESAQQAEDTFMLNVAKSDQTAIGLELQGLELLQKGESDIQQLLNDLTIANAQFEIEGLQEHMDLLSTGFDTIAGDIVNLLEQI